MKKLITLCLVSTALMACEKSEKQPAQPQERSAGRAAIACYDPNPHSATPPGVLHPRACRRDGMTLHLVYESTFPKAPAGCCLLDKIHPAPVQLAQGDSHTALSVSADPNSGALNLVAPTPIPEDPPGTAKTPSVGLFATDLHFGQGAVFSARATYRNPRGPLSGMAWAVGLTARVGGVDDLYDLTRLSVTLRARKGSASMNVPIGAVVTTTPASADLGGRYDAIYVQKQPFTVGMHVDRTSGKGVATLETSGFDPLVLEFEMTDFKKGSGPEITAIGPALADCCAAGADVSVDVTDFQIWIR